MRTDIISGFVDSYLKLSQLEEASFNTELKANNLVEEQEVMEIVTSWMEKGIERGLEQGINRETNLVIRQLKRRVGNISDDLESRIRGLDIDTIEALGEALLDFTSEADLVSWLEHS